MNPAASVFSDSIFVNTKRNFNYENFKDIYIYVYYFVSCIEDFELWYCFQID